MPHTDEPGRPEEPPPTSAEPPAPAPESAPDEPEAPDEPPLTSAQPAESPPEPPPSRKLTPKVAIVAGLVVLAAGLVTAIGLAMRNDDGGSAATTGTSISTTSSSPPPIKGQIDYSCRVMASSSLDAVTAINAYVDTFNGTGEEQAHLADVAVGALDASARRVERTFGPVLPAHLRDALKGYTHAARELSGVISRRGAEEEFNAAVERLNSTKDTALDQCDAPH